MTDIIANYLVKHCVTILKAACVDGNDENARFKDRSIVYEESVGLRDTGYYDISIIEEFLYIVRYCKMNVL